MIELIGAVLFLIVASAICSGSEAAIFSFPITKAKELASKSKVGKLILRIKENPTKPISTIVIGNNLANIVGTYFVAYLATSRLSPSLQAWFPFLLTAVIIVFSEILPKTFGERFHKPIVKLIVRPLLFITTICTPVVWFLEKITKIFVRSSTQTITSESEIRALVQIGEQEGVIDEDERRMIGRVFEMDDKKAADIMTPRTAITWIRNNETIEDVKEKISSSQHSRILVIGETLDDIKGILLKSTYLKLVVDGTNTKRIDECLEPVKMVLGNTPSDELLPYFQKSRVHLAVVVDEYGGVSGVVTLEDVLEVLTGEIMDETDEYEDMRVVARKNGKLLIENHNNGNGLTKRI